MFENTYRFVAFKSTWGISIEIEGVIEEAKPQKEGTTVISEAVFLALDNLSPGLLEHEIAHLVTGLKLLRDPLRQKLASSSVTIRIKRVGFAETDFQPEGLVPAGALWLANTLNVPAPQFRGQLRQILK